MIIALIKKMMLKNGNGGVFPLEILSSTFRYLDFHLEHSQGKLFQYVNAHVNDYAQVVMMMVELGSVIYDDLPFAVQLGALHEWDK